jgi:hypothetical protein
LRIDAPNDKVTDDIVNQVAYRSSNLPRCMCAITQTGNHAQQKMATRIAAHGRCGLSLA